MNEQNHKPPPNLGLDLVRVTEAAALSAGRWMGVGKPDEARQAAVDAMVRELSTVDMDGKIVIGEERRLGTKSPMDSGKKVGNGKGPKMDVVLDPIDGTNLLVHGDAGALSVIAVAPRGSMWSPGPAVYMEKIVVNSEVAPFLVTECLKAPVAWTLALVARAQKKKVQDLVVFVLDRPRHKDLIDEIRTAGARVLQRREGDISGALLAAYPGGKVDVLMGAGGTMEGVVSACAIKSLRGAMLASLNPQAEEEQQLVEKAGLEIGKVLQGDEMINDSHIFFAATGISDGMLLSGVRYHGSEAETESLVLRGETGTRRTIDAVHNLDDIIKSRK